MGIIVVDALGLLVSVSLVLLGRLVLLLVDVKIVGVLVDVVTTVGHHLDGGGRAPRRALLIYVCVGGSRGGRGRLGGGSKRAWMTGVIISWEGWFTH